MMRFCYPLCTGLHVYPQFLAQELMVVVTLTVATVFAKVTSIFEVLIVSTTTCMTHNISRQCNDE